MTGKKTWTLTPQTLTPGHILPWTLTPGTYTPLDTYPLDIYPLDRYPLGHVPPRHIPPGHIPPGHIPPIVCNALFVLITHCTLKNIYFARIAFICNVDAVKLIHICCEEGCELLRLQMGILVGGICSIL